MEPLANGIGPNMSPSIANLLLLLALLLSLSGCELGLEDDPCQFDEDCSDELFCDIHEAETVGSCQEPHDH